jgi:hypothetical protein
MDLPEKPKSDSMSTDDIALIDEISGLTQHMEGILQTQNVPETVKDRIRSRMFTYQGTKPKE